MDLPRSNQVQEAVERRMEREREEEARWRAGREAEVARQVLSHTIFFLVSLRKPVPPQNRQVIVGYHELKHKVDGFVGESTSQTD